MKLVRKLVLGTTARPVGVRRPSLPTLSKLPARASGRRLPVRFVGFGVDNEGAVVPVPVTMLELKARGARELLKGAPVLRLDLRAAAVEGEPLGPQGS